MSATMIGTHGLTLAVSGKVVETKLGVTGEFKKSLLYSVVVSTVTERVGAG